MAKLFYNIDEVAEKLGITREGVEELVDRNELHQYKDRDKVLFKRDEVDGMAQAGLDDSRLEMQAPDTSGDSSTIPLADSGELSMPDANDATDIADATMMDTGAAPAQARQEAAPTSGRTPEASAETPDRLNLEDTGEISLEDTGRIELSDTGDLSGTGEISLSDTGMMETDEVPLSDTGQLGQTEIELSDTSTGELNLSDTDQDTGEEDERQATGVSVFDADEVDHADPMAQTLVTDESQVEDINLESVGSGSGLLDLTRESDDTSLGAELLDEIYPGGEGGETRMMDSGVASSGVFDGGVTVQSETATELGEITELPAGVDEEEPLQPVDTAGPAVVTRPAAAEVYSPIASAATAGAFIAVTAIFVLVAIIVVSSAVMGTPSQLLTAVTSGSQAFYLFIGICALGVAAFAGIGALVGKLGRG